MDEGALSQQLPDSLNFWEHIAPISTLRCAPCHNPNGGAPFSLLGYSDFIKRKRTIKQVVSDGYMPPWPANPGYQRYKDEKLLSPYEKLALLQWIEGGAREGQPPRHDTVAYGIAHRAEPDAILLFPDTVQISGSLLDRFFIAKLGFELPADTFLASIAFVPGNKRLLHHVNGHLLNYQAPLKRDVHDGSWLEDAEVRTSLGAYADMKVAHDDGSFPAMRVSAFNYLPGVEPVRYPPGIGSVRISRKGAFLLNTLHYGPSPIDTFDLSAIYLYYDSLPPTRPLQELHLGTQSDIAVHPPFVIPANEISHFSTRYTLEQDVSVLTVNPHMHLLGKSFKAYAHSANGLDTIPLIHIPKWDFRWQYFYTFRQMLKLPKGYTIVAEASFDNTVHNPFNPFVPPKTLKAAGRNMKTTDEMFQFFVNFVPYQEGDEYITL